MVFSDYGRGVQFHSREQRLTFEEPTVQCRFLGTEIFIILDHIFKIFFGLSQLVLYDLGFIPQSLNMLSFVTFPIRDRFFRIDVLLIF